MIAEGAADTRRSWRWRVVLAVVVAVQIAVPAIAAFMPPPTRLGWQMYSGQGELPSIRLERADNSRIGVSLADVVAKARPELDWTAYLPRYLCSENPDAVRGTLEYELNSFEFEC